ncbi:MAG: hypothetical protein LBD68_08960 [Zoogloeaceae bacterium]|nr:hypothetical protein [Zoogloeaceae bacterium]
MRRPKNRLRLMMKNDLESTLRQRRDDVPQPCGIKSPSFDGLSLMEGESGYSNSMIT